MTTEEKIAEVERLLKELENETKEGDTFTITLPQRSVRWRVDFGSWAPVTSTLEYWKSSAMDC